MPSERFSDGIFCVFREGAGSYSGLTKIGTRRRAAGSTNGTEPVRPVLGRLRE
ncbi:transposase, partial [Neisseria gonorrhoeae]